MIELTAVHYEELCAGEPVKSEIESLETKRRTAVRQFWIRLVGGLLLVILGIYAMAAAGLDALAWVIAVFLLIGVVIVAILPLGRAAEDLKLPTLETLAAKGGMEFMPSGFDPPVYPMARGPLFGKWLSDEKFTDLFHGTDADGKRFALYEANLVQGNGKNQHTVFTGQVYAFQRGRTGSGETVIVPDRGLFNFFKPQKGMERVRIEDEAFEKKFEVYSTAPGEARSLVFGSDLRRQLLELREAGRVFVYVGPEDAMIAATSKNRYEAGSMFRRRTGAERVRTMFDDLRGALASLRALKRAIG